MGRGTPAFPVGGDGAGSPADVGLPGIGREGKPALPGDGEFGLPGALPGTVDGISGGGIPSPPQEPTVPQRLYPTFDVLGLGPMGSNAEGVVQEIYFEDTIGFDLPMAKVVLYNKDKTLSSTDKAREQSKFTIMIGYAVPPPFLHGPYIVQRPKFRFQANERPLTVEIVGYGEAVKLGATERREKYEKMKDSDIAAKIAGRYGFGIDSVPTDPVHDLVLQANESDWKFLSKRAKLYGFMLYVEKGVLHFHPPRPRESGYKLQYLERGQTDLMDFVVHSRTFMRGLQLRLTQIDPFSKEEINETSTEDPDPVQAATQFMNWKELVTIPGPGGGQPKRFITNEGHEQRRPLLKFMNNRMAQSTRYVISGVGNCVGLEKLRANDLVTIEGIGRSSGKYFVTRAIHHIAPHSNVEGGYSVKIEVVRAGAEELGSATTGSGGNTGGTIVTPSPANP